MARVGRCRAAGEEVVEGLAVGCLETLELGTVLKLSADGEDGGGA
jgi:hypothetical protein